MVREGTAVPIARHAWKNLEEESQRSEGAALAESIPGSTQCSLVIGDVVLSIPAIRDRVVQGALKLILEPIFEADFQPGSFGYRPRSQLMKRSTAWPKQSFGTRHASYA